MQIETIWSQFLHAEDRDLTGAVAEVKVWCALGVKLIGAVLPRAVGVAQCLDHCLSIDVGERGQHVMIEGPLESVGDLFEIAQNVSRWVGVHDGGHENAFAHAPLGDADGLDAVDEYFTRSASGKTHESIRGVSLERSLVHRDLATDDAVENVGPPLAGHARAGVYVTAPPMVADGYPPIDPKVVGLHEDESATTPTSTKRYVDHSMRVEDVARLSAAQDERRAIRAHNVECRLRFPAQRVVVVELGEWRGHDARGRYGAHSGSGSGK